MVQGLVGRAASFRENNSSSRACSLRARTSRDRRGCVRLRDVAVVARRRAGADGDDDHANIVASYQPVRRRRRLLRYSRVTSRTGYWYTDGNRHLRSVARPGQV